MCSDWQKIKTTTGCQTLQLHVVLLVGILTRDWVMAFETKGWPLLSVTLTLPTLKQTHSAPWILLKVNFKLFVPCIFSTYGMQTNWCHYFIRILLDLYMFRAHSPIIRRVRTAVHTTIGSVPVPLCSRALYTAREQNGTDTETTVVWTAVRTLLKMGLWARNM